jgi:hypothetical protein
MPQLNAMTELQLPRKRRIAETINEDVGVPIIVAINRLQGQGILGRLFGGKHAEGKYLYRSFHSNSHPHPPTLSLSQSHYSKNITWKNRLI